MRRLKTFLTLSLTVIMITTNNISAFATPQKSLALPGKISGIEENSDSDIEYTEQRDEKILETSIASTIVGNQVICIETKPNGQTQTYSVSAKVKGLTETNGIAARSKTIVWPDRYGIFPSTLYCKPLCK